MSRVPNSTLINSRKQPHPLDEHVEGQVDLGRGTESGERRVDRKTSAGVCKVRNNAVEANVVEILHHNFPCRGTAKHRSRCHSHSPASVQGMATVAVASGTSPAARAAALFGEAQLDSEEGMVDENRLVTLEDVKGQLHFELM